MRDSMDWSHSGSIIIPVLVLFFISRRSMRGTRVRTDRMWLFPSIMAVLTIATLARGKPPTMVALAGFATTFVIGAIIGWLRARHQRLTIDPSSGQVIAKVTPVGMILIGVFFVARYALDLYQQSHDLAHAVGLQRITDAGLIFSTSMMLASRWEIWRRATPMLAAYRAKKAAAPDRDETGI